MTSPTPTPPSTAQTRLAAACGRENVPVTTAATANLKNTSAVPSLTRLSPSITEITRRGTPNRRPIADAAMGSVGDTTAPSTNAAGHDRPMTPCATAATATIVAVTSPTASNEIGLRFCRSSRSPVLKAAE